MNVGLVRARRHATQALLKAAEAMPWGDQFAIIRVDNSFRLGSSAAVRRGCSVGGTIWFHKVGRMTAAARAIANA
jgi:hypothetical protein